MPVLLAGLLLAAMSSFRHWAAAHPEQLVGPRPAGLAIANSGSKRISRVEVTYPGGAYTISDLAPNGGLAENDRAVIQARGPLTLDIVYADGRRFRRTASIRPPSPPQELCINIMDNGEVWWP